MIHYTEILRASLDALNAELAADGRASIQYHPHQGRSLRASMAGMTGV
jgi:hypothetical protein